MALVAVARQYDAPKEKVWNVFADIGNVQEISPGIESSKRENKKDGVGAQRSCEFGKGAGITEEVTAWTDGERMQFTGIAFRKAPMKKMVATFDFKEQDGKTLVSCVMDYDMKMGFLLNPIAKGANKKAIKGMLDGVAAKLD
ncbi:MAG: SRPBCC family protein [Thermoplasmatota archaeon]